MQGKEKDINSSLKCPTGASIYDQHQFKVSGKRIISRMTRPLYSKGALFLWNIFDNSNQFKSGISSALGHPVNLCFCDKLLVILEIVFIT